MNDVFLLGRTERVVVKITETSLFYRRYQGKFAPHGPYKQNPKWWFEGEFGRNSNQFITLIKKHVPAIVVKMKKKKIYSNTYHVPKPCKMNKENWGGQKN